VIGQASLSPWTRDWLSRDLLAEGRGLSMVGRHFVKAEGGVRFYSRERTDGVKNRAAFFIVFNTMWG